MSALMDETLVDDAAWAAARRLGTWSYATLAAEARMKPSRATRLTRRWVKARLAVSGGLGPKQRRLWTVAPGAEALRAAAPAGTVEGNLWRTMRTQALFSPTDLMAMSSTPSVAVTLPDAVAYCEALAAADYLAVVRKPVPGKREAVYRLVENTGPRPPVVRRVRALVDPNLGSTIPLAGRAA